MEWPFCLGRLQQEGSHSEPGGSSNQHCNLGVIKSCGLQNSLYFSYKPLGVWCCLVSAEATALFFFIFENFIHIYKDIWSCLSFTSHSSLEFTLHSVVHVPGFGAIPWGMTNLQWPHPQSRMILLSQLLAFAGQGSSSRKAWDLKSISPIPVRLLNSFLLFLFITSQGTLAEALYPHCPGRR